MSLLEVTHLKKIYTARYGGNAVQALTDVNFTLEPGEYTAIMGESGSGKTTLLNIIATLDRPTSGTVRLNGQELSTIPERQLAEFRRKNLGFVFQDFNLLDTFTIRDNILLPLVLDRVELKEMDRQLEALSNQLGLNDLLDHFPYEVSGGQKQRLTLAVSDWIDTPVLILDEPTSGLDFKNMMRISEHLKALAQKGKTILIITHDYEFAAMTCNRVLHFVDEGHVETFPLQENLSRLYSCLMCQ